MTNHPKDRKRPPRANPAPAGIAACSEPEVRRWPHPVCGTEPAREAGCSLSAETACWLQCTLSRQSQLLEDIKALLEQPADESTETAEEK